MDASALEESLRSMHAATSPLPAPDLATDVDLDVDIGAYDEAYAGLEADAERLRLVSTRVRSLIASQQEAVAHVRSAHKDTHSRLEALSQKLDRISSDLLELGRQVDALSKHYQGLADDMALVRTELVGLHVTVREAGSHGIEAVTRSERAEAMAAQAQLQLEDSERGSSPSRAPLSPRVNFTETLPLHPPSVRARALSVPSLPPRPKALAEDIEMLRLQLDELRPQLHMAARSDAAHRHRIDELTAAEEAHRRLVRDADAQHQKRALELRKTVDAQVATSRRLQRMVGLWSALFFLGGLVANVLAAKLLGGH